MSTDATPLRKLETPNALLLAEFLLFESDLDECINAIYLRETMAGEGDKADVVGRALFTHAIVRFISCFDKYHRHPLDQKVIYGADDGGLEYYQYLLDLRDSFLAHRFGPLRQCHVGVFLQPHPPGSRAVGNCIMMSVGIDRSEAHMVGCFIMKALTWVRSEIARVTALIEAEVEMMDADEIEKLPMARLYGVSNSEMRTGREKFIRDRDVRHEKSSS